MAFDYQIRQNGAGYSSTEGYILEDSHNTMTIVESNGELVEITIPQNSMCLVITEYDNNKEGETDSEMMGFKVSLYVNNPLHGSANTFSISSKSKIIYSTNLHYRWSWDKYEAKDWFYNPSGYLKILGVNSTSWSPEDMYYYRSYQTIFQFDMYDTLNVITDLLEDDELFDHGPTVFKTETVLLPSSQFRMSFFED